MVDATAGLALNYFNAVVLRRHSDMRLIPDAWYAQLHDFCKLTQATATLLHTTPWDAQDVHPHKVFVSKCPVRSATPVAVPNYLDDTSYQNPNTFVIRTSNAAAFTHAKLGE